MAARKEMSIGERRKYLGRMVERYRQASRAEKTELLAQMEYVTQMHRKSIIRLLHPGALHRKKRRRQRGKTYGGDVRYALSVIAESFGYPCAERSHGNLVWMADLLVEHGELQLTPALRDKLEVISVSTIHRLLKKVSKDEHCAPRSRPKARNALAASISAGRLPWDETEPGHLEIDLVHHSRESSQGEYAYSLQMVDVATGWSEIAAILGRSQMVVEDACQRIKDRIPFKILQLHPDNGSEFLNHHLMRFWRKTVPQLRWSRSRPYEKNDNRFVEQKNSSLVRAYFGRELLDTVDQVNTMNAFYEKLRIYYNLFQPVMRLKEKRFVEAGQGNHRVRRVYGQARTPFDRLCATGAISEETVAAWEQLQHRINPRQLRRELYQLVDAIVRMPNADGNCHAQDVYLTLHRTGGESPLQ